MIEQTVLNNYFKVYLRAVAKQLCVQRTFAKLLWFNCLFIVYTLNQTLLTSCVVLVYCCQIIMQRIKFTLRF